MTLRAGICALLLAPPLAAQDGSAADPGRAAWNDIFAVISHPRCSNCHVDADTPPMWNGLGYGTGVVHGMNMRAGESRVGAETTPCRSCHVTAPAANEIAHAPPMVADAWRLPPPELGWLGKSSAEACAQLRGGTQPVAALVPHLESSAFVAWGFAPGAGRSAPQGSLSDMIAAVETWIAADTPCPIAQ